MKVIIAVNRGVKLGRVMTTPAALKAIPQDCVQAALARHQKGDWGDLDPQDKTANDRALRDRGRLLSAYHAPDGTKFWIITEADRSYTTVLLPEDY